MSLLGVGSVPATNMRQNQSQVDGRTPTTNSLHQGSGGETPNMVGGLLDVS